MLYYGLSVSSQAALRIQNIDCLTPTTTAGAAAAAAMTARSAIQSPVLLRRRIPKTPHSCHLNFVLGFVAALEWGFAPKRSIIGS